MASVYDLIGIDIRAPSLALLATLILALIGREDVRLTKLAAQLPGKALQRSKVKQLHRFFKNIWLSEDVLARFVLSFADPKEGPRHDSEILHR